MYNDLLINTINIISSTDKLYENKLKEKLKKGLGTEYSLGYFEDLLSQLAGIYKTLDIKIKNPVIINFLKNDLEYRKKINKLSKRHDMEIVNIDYDVKNFGMKESILAINLGINIVRLLYNNSCNFIVGSDIINNKDISSAISLLYSFNKDIYLSTLRDKFSNEILKNVDTNIHINEKIVEVYFDIDNILSNKDDKFLNVFNITYFDEQSNNRYIVNISDSLHKLANYGTFDISVLVGIIIGCGIYRIPFILDDIVTIAAASIAMNINRKIINYIFSPVKYKNIFYKNCLENLNIEGYLESDVIKGSSLNGIYFYSFLKNTIDIYDDVVINKNI